MSERERIQFVVDRDGPVAAIEWAERTLAIYVEDSVRKGPHAASIKELREWLAEVRAARAGKETP